MELWSLDVEQYTPTYKSIKNFATTEITETFIPADMVGDIHMKL